MTNSKAICIFSILIMLSLAIISAQTLVAGKIYNSQYSYTIPDVDLLITCNSSSLSTKSLEDGVYAVRFEETECAKDDIVTVTGDKFGFIQKTTSGIINKCETGNCGGSYFAIINFALELKTSTSTTNNKNKAFGSARYYSCGNGICDTGETVSNCPEDCSAQLLSAENQENLQEGTKETKLSSNFFTGAITGITDFAKSKLGIFLFIIFIGLLIVLVIFLKKMKKA